MNIRTALLSCLCALSFAASAAVTWRWVDDNGRVHYSDTVPDKFKKTATKVDTTPSELNADQKAEAKARAERERLAAEARAREANARAARNAPAASAPASAAAAAASGPRTAGGIAPPGNDCASQQQAYRASQECFAPFRNVNGSIKTEAYEKCVEVPDPSPRCGITPLN